MGASIVINLDDCLIRAATSREVVALDPGSLLKHLPPALLDHQSRLYVMIMHKGILVEMRLDVFMRMDHRVATETLCIGSQKIPLKDTSFTIGFKVELEDLSDLVDIPVD